MLVLTHPSHDHDLPREPQRSRRSSIVWQAHTEGFATIAYRDGRAIAGISGPWSNKYVLIWWQPSDPLREVETFDSLDHAKQAVTLGSAVQAPTQLDGLLPALRRDHDLQLPGWLRRLRAAWSRYASRSKQHCAHCGRDRSRPAVLCDEETDLRGLNFRAKR